MSSSTSREGHRWQLVMSRVFRVLLHTQGLPIFLVCAVLAILFVLFRMKVVEMDYSSHAITEKINKMIVEQKELDAVRAQLLSANNLRSLAKKYKFNQPRREQIIIIPK